MKLYIKNMVCGRCKMVVKQLFESAGLNPVSVELGEVELTKALTGGQKAKVTKALQLMGFDIINDQKSRTIEKIKTLIVELVHDQNNSLSVNLSEYLSERLNKDYSMLSHLFSEVEASTIEKYFIAQKIEKVKELLVYDELSLSEIAFQLNYSSVGYLSNQFKKITGFTPTHFKKLKGKKRKQLEDI